VPRDLGVVPHWDFNIMIFYKCSTCGNRVTRLSIKAFMNSWKEGYGHQYSLGFKCSTCSSRYIFPWYSGFLSGILIFLALIFFKAERCLVYIPNFCDEYFPLVNLTIIFIFIFVSYAVGPLVELYRNESWNKSNKN
jgi:DNA-directed RNA polymerase subunit RPC12/RpoP